MSKYDIPPVKTFDDKINSVLVRIVDEFETLGSTISNMRGYISLLQREFPGSSETPSAYERSSDRADFIRALKEIGDLVRNQIATKRNTPNQPGYLKLYDDLLKRFESEINKTLESYGVKDRVKIKPISDMSSESDESGQRAA